MAMKTSFTSLKDAVEEYGKEFVQNLLDLYVFQTEPRTRNNLSLLYLKGKRLVGGTTKYCYVNVNEYYLQYSYQNGRRIGVGDKHVRMRWQNGSNQIKLSITFVENEIQEFHTY